VTKKNKNKQSVSKKHCIVNKKKKRAVSVLDVITGLCSGEENNSI